MAGSLLAEQTLSSCSAVAWRSSMIWFLCFLLPSLLTDLHFIWPWYLELRHDLLS